MAEARIARRLTSSKLDANSWIMDHVASEIERRIASRLKALRAKRALTLDELARRSGVSRSMISLVERAESSATASVLDKLAASNKEKLDWRHSIVDLMKLLNLDSSLAARKELAGELHFTGDKNDSASMNIWLHKQVMTKLAENGGKVPDELRK